MGKTPEWRKGLLKYENMTQDQKQHVIDTCKYYSVAVTAKKMNVSQGTINKIFNELYNKKRKL